MFFQVLLDRLLKRRDTPERTATDPFFGDLREEPLDLVQPRTACRREMQMVFGMTQEPPLHGRRFVGAVVVHDQMDLDAGFLGHTRVDLV